MKKQVQYVVIFFISLMISPPVFGQNSLDDIIGDITLPHEGRPHGVPSNWDWAQKPRVGAVEPPEGWTAAIAWGQLYEWIEGNPATNTRVQIKDMEMYYLSKSDGQWHLLQKDVKVAGAAYVEDFAGDVNKPADIRKEEGGSISVTAGDGYNFHFWPSKGRTTFPKNDVAGCFSTVQARLILDDPTGIDDRADARYVLSVGGDWWLSLTAVWDNWTTNADMGIGRFRFVTSEWKSYNLITVPVETVQQNPPPFVSGESAVNELYNGNMENFRLEQNYPNPFNGTTTISYALTRAADVLLTIYGLDGRKVATLVDEKKQAGLFQSQWNAENVASGLYFYMLQVGPFSQTKKLILQK